MPQAWEEGKSSYRERSPRPRVDKDERSAEAIVAGSNEPSQRGGGTHKPAKGWALGCFKCSKEVCPPSFKRNMAKGNKRKRMIEQVLNSRNIMRAYRQVLSNKGSAGVDGMTVKETYAYLTKKGSKSNLIFVEVNVLTPCNLDKFYATD